MLLIPLSEDEKSLAQEIEKELRLCGVRVQVDSHGGSLSKRLLFAHRLRPAYLSVIGGREKQSRRIKLQGRERVVEIDLGHWDGLLGDFKIP